MGYFELILLLLFALALIDLSVGVSNDAVNFLNSAIGSRVASREVILAVAGAGVLAGSLFSSGIMEVARSGIFNPELFTFADVMVIFLAVMIADVLLLDLFNTLGLPTSTTVSIVFELLGAAFAVATLLVIASNDAGAVLDYIRVDRALMIIGGIGLSIVFAFITGTIVQFFSRLLFTFEKKNHTAAIRIGWSAIAFTIISFFLIIKGLKGVGFIAAEDYQYLYDHMGVISLVSLVFWAAVMWLLSRMNVDLLAIVVFGGTFSLALAFASNDLVNFIGVPLAGLAAWQAWANSGVAPDELTMDALRGPVTGNTLILVSAGIVMVVTLWLSSKARSVTRTEVNLARQDEGSERFKPGPVSRGIVRSVLATGEVAMQAVPAQWRTGLADRFAREKKERLDLEQPAFDTLRASVNLTVASVLIVFATSLKLPLSTTFVSFMVAMGTSLADRAWGRDNAVYRIAGVFSVVGGWFLTAAAAFTIAATFAVLIKTFGIYAVVALAAFAALALVHSHRYHDRQTKMEEVSRQASPDRMDRDALTLRKHFLDSVQRHADVVDAALHLLVKRKRKLAKKLRKGLQADSEATIEAENEFVRRLDRIQPNIEPWLIKQLDTLESERDMLKSAERLAELASEHVINEHSPPTEAVVYALNELRLAFRDAYAQLGGELRGASTPTARSQVSDIAGSLDRLAELIIRDLYADERSTRNTTLMLGIVVELRGILRELKRVAAWY